MIWFATLPERPAALPYTPGPDSETIRMEQALRAVAAREPALGGRALLDALADTGLVDRTTAARLLPAFRTFDADRCFAEELRRLSFRGTGFADEFRFRILRAVEDLTGEAQLGEVGPEPALRFRHDGKEGVLLAYPEVAWSIGAHTRAAIGAAIEEMPDALVVVARNFAESTAAQFASLLDRTGVPGTLLSVNLLLGMRATALRYQPGAERVLQLLGVGRPLRSADIATLGNR